MRIGIFGGTFNPPHTGHLLLAQAAMEGAKLDRIIFMPCATPPHKTETHIPDGKHRYRMVELATEDDSRFELSNMEINAGGKSYTALTLKHLEELYPEDRLCFIVGADSLCDMEKWYHPEEVFGRAEIVVAYRGGEDTVKMDEAAEYFEEKYGAEITRVSMPVIEMSSSDIRQRISEGRSVRYMVCDKVIDYINKTGIYKENI